MNRQNEPPRRSDMPECGYYLIRPFARAKREEYLPATLEMRATIGGRPCGEPNAEPFAADGVERVWLGIRVTKEEYDAAMARVADTDIDWEAVNLPWE